MSAVVHCFSASPLRPPAKRQRLAEVSSLGRRSLCRAAAGGHAEAEVAVVGAGAAGLAAAHFAALSGARVTVLEKTAQAGNKVLISGGTRCNVLPGDVDLVRDYVTESSQSALRAVFSTWSLDDCEFWLSDPHQVGLRLALEESTNKYFPASNSAKEVRDKLVAACQRAGVSFRYNAGLEDMEQQPGGSWRLDLAGGVSLEAGRVVLATGGLSYPKTGTTGDGYSLLQRLGHALHAPYPALTPLLGTHPGGDHSLAGISLYNAELAAVPAGSSAGGGKKKKAGKAKRAQRTALLLTHRGWSGPAVLDLSHHAVRALERGEAPAEIIVQWTPEGAAALEERLLAGGAALVVSALRREGLPQRLAEALCVESGIPLDRKLAELQRGERAALIEACTRYHMPVTGHEGYPKAEVTGGGVPLNELDCATMESRLLPGVHICGELVDVFGRIGGYNFFWAFTSARLAGLAAAEAAAAGPSSGF